MMADEIIDVSPPEVGALPDPVPLQPGETSDLPDRHYRNRDTRSPLCGAMPSDDTPYARKWSDVSCAACVANKPERGRKTKKAKTADGHKDSPKVEQIPNDERAMLSDLVIRGTCAVFYHNRLPPPPMPALVPFAQSGIGVLEHYGLLTAVSHPLGAFAASTLVLWIAIKDFEPIEDEAQLRKAHGIPDGQV